LWKETSVHWCPRILQLDGIALRVGKITTYGSCFPLLWVSTKLKSLSFLASDMFYSAMAGAAMISNSPGTVADMTNEHYRALAFSIWSIGPMNGPVTGPLIGGFAAQYLGWRWTNWLVIIFSGVAWFMCATMKETYAPAILQKKAARMRKETGDDRWWCRYVSSHEMQALAGSVTNL
jgi:MFS family permease